MDVTLYQNLSGTENDLSPNLTQVAKYTGVQVVEPWRSESFGASPLNDDEIQIRMTVPTDTLRWDRVNYFEFDGAYYYLDSVDKPANTISIINGKMDYLHTYASAIRGWTALFERKTGGTLRAEDEARLVSADSKRSVFRFADQISKTENAGVYVLVTSQKGFEGAL